MRLFPKHVQQPCSNPSKSPEMLRKVLSSECCHLQAFCTHLKIPANLRAALAWRRSRVRVSSGPLQKTYRFAGKTSRARDGAGMLWGFGAATRRAYLSLSSNTCGTPGCIHDLSCIPLRSCSLRTSTPRSCRRCSGALRSLRRWTPILTSCQTCRTEQWQPWRARYRDNDSRPR